MTTDQTTPVAQLAARYIAAIHATMEATACRVFVGLSPHADRHPDLPASWVQGLPDEPSATMDLEYGRQVLDQVTRELPRRGLQVAQENIRGHDRSGAGLVLGWRFEYH